MNEKDGLAAIARRRPLVDKSQADPMVEHFEHALPPFRGTFPHRPRVYACTEPEVSPDTVAKLAKLRYHVSKFVRIEPRLR